MPIQEPEFRAYRLSTNPDMNIGGNRRCQYWYGVKRCHRNADWAVVLAEGADLDLKYLCGDHLNESTEGNHVLMGE